MLGNSQEIRLVFFVATLVMNAAVVMGLSTLLLVTRSLATVQRKQMLALCVFARRLWSC